MKFINLTTPILVLTFFCFSLNAQNQVGIDIDGEVVGDQSGNAVSLSSDGTRVAIGAALNDRNGNSSGHVRIYEEDGEVWTQVGNDIDGEAAGDQSGWAVSLSSDGTRVAIGARHNGGTGTLAGHVRIYEENNGTWTQVGNDIDGEAANDRSGWSVSLSSDGTRVAIGAIANNDGNGTSTANGHVRIYEERSSGTWMQIGSDIDAETINDRFGWSVSLSSDGTRVAIGAIFNSGSNTLAGHVKIYKENNGTWTQVGNDINGAVAGDRSGWSVSLSSNGTRVAIGSGSDYVRIYEESSGNWTQVGNDLKGETIGDQFGSAVSLSSAGTRVAIGAQSNNGNGNNTGRIRVYEENGGTWSQLGSDIHGEAIGDQFGSAVSLSADGNRVAIGAEFNDENGTDAGHVRIYKYQDATPSQLCLRSKVYPNSTIRGDHFGSSAKMDNQGVRIIFGAYRKTINGLSRHGAAYIFHKDSNGWMEEVKLVDPSGNTVNEFGTSVSISGNGRLAVVGAPLEGDNDQGAVYIFERIGPTWNTTPIRISENLPNDKFGQSVDIDDDGTRIIVGVPGNNQDRVIVYESDSGNWVKSQTIPQPSGGPGDAFGFAVSLSGDGNYLVVGAHRQNGGGYIYEYDGNGWNLAYSQSGASGAKFGNAVSIDNHGQFAVIGAHRHTVNGASIGAVFVIKRQGDIWPQEAIALIPTPTYGGNHFDHFGWKVAMSDDGTKIVVGSYQDSSNDGSFWRSGSAYLYTRNGNSWDFQKKLTAHPNEASGDFFGYSVAINATGNRIGIGAPYNDDHQKDGGSAYLFEESYQNIKVK